MEEYVINWNGKLNGKLKIKGAKNAILPIMAASILCEDRVYLDNCPNITDIHSMLDILNSLGCKTYFNFGILMIDSKNIQSYEIKNDLACKLRSSIFMLGPLLSRLKCAKIAHPGGCNIGLRPIDVHLKALRGLGVKVIENRDDIYCSSKNSKASKIVLDIPSVGATENIIMASVFVKGTTVIENCAMEPEVEDLQNFLVMMGAKITGIGKSVVTIEGVNKLHGVTYLPIPDRIVLGTFMIMTSMIGGEVEFENVNISHLQSLISKIDKSSCKLLSYNDRLFMKSLDRPKSIKRIETMYYPGFPTDLQAQILALQTISKGKSIISENIFETRFKSAKELLKMGAKIDINDKFAIIDGVDNLYPAKVKATDLRGGAALVLASMTIEGQSVVSDIYHIDRGYEDLSLLNSIGANIKRVQNE